MISDEMKKRLDEIEQLTKEKKIEAHDAFCLRLVVSIEEYERQTNKKFSYETCKELFLKRVPPISTE
tara:strand:+ start:953 stop:1153 length:201 start_codon:yes stop_codon:yes gene_type:complete